MKNRTGIHGGDHRPGGPDPTRTGPWHYVIDPGTSPAWSSGTAYAVDDLIEHDVYRYVAVAASTNVEPGVAAAWPDSWAIDVPLFQNGWGNAAPSAGIPNPSPMAFRLSVGPPNPLDDTGAIAAYSEHQIDVAGDVAGGDSGTAVFTLPPAYRLPYDKPVSGHDELMAYVASRLYSSGEFVRGTA